jgi:hypothetical protein
MPALIIAAGLYLTLIYVCGRFTAKYAARRGRSETAWFVLGGLFYPFPYIVLALLPPLRSDLPGAPPRAPRRWLRGSLPRRRPPSPDLRVPVSIKL